MGSCHDRGLGHLLHCLRQSDNATHAFIRELCGELAPGGTDQTACHEILTLNVSFGVVLFHTHLNAVAVADPATRLVGTSAMRGTCRLTCVTVHGNHMIDPYLA